MTEEKLKRACYLAGRIEVLTKLTRVLEEVLGSELFKQPESETSLQIYSLGLNVPVYIDALERILRDDLAHKLSELAELQKEFEAL